LRLLWGPPQCNLKAFWGCLEVHLNATSRRLEVALRSTSMQSQGVLRLPWGPPQCNPKTFWHCPKGPDPLPYSQTSFLNSNLSFNLFIFFLHKIIWYLSLWKFSINSVKKCDCYNFIAKNENKLLNIWKKVQLIWNSFTRCN
jgi:hypothetical protein